MRILLMITFCVATQSINAYPDTQLLTNKEMKLVIDQAQLLLQNGASLKEVLHIFEKNLEQEKFSAAKPKAKPIIILTLAAGVVGFVIGGVIIYNLTPRIPESDEIARLTQENEQLTGQVTALTTQIAEHAANPPQNPNNIDLADLLRQINEQGNIDGIRTLLNNPRVTGDRQIAAALMRIYRNS